MLKLKLQYPGRLIWSEEPTYWKRPWCWERLRAGGEGVTEDEMAGWHHRLNGHEFEQTPGEGEGQGSLCDALHGITKADMTEHLNNSCHHSHPRSPPDAQPRPNWITAPWGQVQAAASHHPDTILPPKTENPTASLFFWQMEMKLTSRCAFSKEFLDRKTQGSSLFRGYQHVLQLRVSSGSETFTPPGFLGRREKLIFNTPLWVCFRGTILPPWDVQY